MSQPDIAIQPRETAVTAALRVLAAGADWCVTHTTDGSHATNSLHYVGRAVDLAARSGPGVDTPQLLAINQAVLKLIPMPMISELIYAGPGGVCVKNGKVVNGMAFYGAATMAEHHNHVHLGVVPNFTYSAPKQEAPVADTPPDYAINIGPNGDLVVGISAVFDSAGNVKGYYILGADGGVFGFGQVPYLGRVHKA